METTYRGHCTKYGGMQSEEGEPLAISTDSLYIRLSPIRSTPYKRITKPVPRPAAPWESTEYICSTIHKYPPKQDCPLIQLTCFQWTVHGSVGEAPKLCHPLLPCQNAWFEPAWTWSHALRPGIVLWLETARASWSPFSECQISRSFVGHPRSLRRALDRCPS